MSGDFGVFESEVTSGFERREKSEAFLRKIDSAAYDVQKLYGEHLVSKDSREFDSRWRLASNDICRTIEQTIFPKSGVVRRVKAQVKKSSIKTSTLEWDPRGSGAIAELGQYSCGVQEKDDGNWKWYVFDHSAKKTLQEGTDITRLNAESSAEQAVQSLGLNTSKVKKSSIKTSDWKSTPEFENLKELVGSGSREELSSKLEQYSFISDAVGQFAQANSISEGEVIDALSRSTSTTVDNSNVSKMAGTVEARPQNPDQDLDPGSILQSAGVAYEDWSWDDESGYYTVTGVHPEDASEALYSAGYETVSPKMSSKKAEEDPAKPQTVDVEKEVDDQPSDADDSQYNETDYDNQGGAASEEEKTSSRPKKAQGWMDSQEFIGLLGQMMEDPTADLSAQISSLSQSWGVSESEVYDALTNSLEDPDFTNNFYASRPKKSQLKKSDLQVGDRVEYKGVSGYQGTITGTGEEMGISGTLLVTWDNQPGDQKPYTSDALTKIGSRPTKSSLKKALRPTYTDSQKKSDRSLMKGDRVTFNGMGAEVREIKSGDKVLIHVPDQGRKFLVDLSQLTKKSSQKKAIQTGDTVELVGDTVNPDFPEVQFSQGEQFTVDTVEVGSDGVNYYYTTPLSGGGGSREDAAVFVDDELRKVGSEKKAGVDKCPECGSTDITHDEFKNESTDFCEECDWSKTTPKTAQKIAWNFDQNQNLYTATTDEPFTCPNCSTVHSKLGFNRCSCGKIWNSWQVESSDGRKVFCTEVEDRSDLILSSRKKTSLNWQNGSVGFADQEVVIGDGSYSGEQAGGYDYDMIINLSIEPEYDGDPAIYTWSIQAAGGFEFDTGSASSESEAKSQAEAAFNQVCSEEGIRFDGSRLSKKASRPKKADGIWNDEEDALKPGDYGYPGKPGFDEGDMVYLPDEDDVAAITKGDFYGREQYEVTFSDGRVKTVNKWEMEPVTSSRKSEEVRSMKLTKDEQEFTKGWRHAKRGFPVPKSGAASKSFLEGYVAGLGREGEEKERVYAEGRDPEDACQKGTPGCSIDHSRDRGSCETW